MNSALGVSSRRKYIFTPALRTELRLAYALPKKARASAIVALQHKTGWPSHIFRLEAQQLDIVTSHRRPWTKDEDLALASALGRLSLHQLARTLKRTPASVKARAEGLELSRRAESGYNVADLARILGAPHYRVHEWIEKGLLGDSAETPGGEVCVLDDAVMNFIRRNSTLIDFRLANQTFVKRALYGARTLKNSSKGNN